MWTPAPNGRITTAATRSLEIAVAGVTPNSRISIGVISAPPPAPVIPTSRPMIALPEDDVGIDVHRFSWSEPPPRRSVVPLAANARRSDGASPGNTHVSPSVRTRPRRAELRQRAGDGRAARGDQVGEHGVGQPQPARSRRPRTRPQRRARCQSSMCSRTSTRAWWTIAMLTASWRERWTARANRRPASCGYSASRCTNCSSSTARRVGRARASRPSAASGERRPASGPQQVTLADQLGAVAAARCRPGGTSSR